tara:strand:- start:774 stop:950 length:177 start_codon:yes stop_codon:yes gene_type:complete
MTTVTKFQTRFGETAWAVTWGPGLTQTVICSSEEEAAEVAKTHRAEARFVEPLVELVA